MARRPDRLAKLRRGRAAVVLDDRPHPSHIRVHDSVNSLKRGVDGAHGVNGREIQAEGGSHEQAVG